MNTLELAQQIHALIMDVPHSQMAFSALEMARQMYLAEISGAEGQANLSLTATGKTATSYKWWDNQ